MRRRLSAILAADIVGYTRLMGADQEGTLQALLSFRRDIFSPTIEAYSGRIIKNMGDGWLVEFDTAVDAASCALNIQARVRSEVPFRLRIGLNVGDIVHEQEDIFGDGVNVAARLQEVATPGGIAISGSVYDSLDGRLRPEFRNAGQHDLKNVDRRVQVWLRSTDGQTLTNSSLLTSGATGIAKLAILPIERSVGRADLADLADGLTADILRLMETSDFVNARVTGQPDAQDYVLLTVLRGRGERFRLETQLETPARNTFWKAAFDGELAESFAWQDNTAQEVAANIVGGILDTERTTLVLSSERTPAACAAVEFFEMSPSALIATLTHLCSPITGPTADGDIRDQTRRLATATLVTGCSLQLVESGWDVPQLLALSGTDQPDRPCLASAIRDHLNRPDAGALDRTARNALAENPFDADTLCFAGWCFTWLGQPSEAIDCFRRFDELGRFNSLAMATRAGLATAFVQGGRDHEAIHRANEVRQITTEFAAPYLVTAAASAHLGDLAGAQDATRHLRRLCPNLSLTTLRSKTGFIDAEATDRFFQGLKNAGLPEH